MKTNKSKLKIEIKKDENIIVKLKEPEKKISRNHLSIDDINVFSFNEPVKDIKDIQDNKENKNNKNQENIKIKK